MTKLLTQPTIKQAWHHKTQQHLTCILLFLWTSKNSPRLTLVLLCASYSLCLFLDSFVLLRVRRLLLIDSRSCSVAHTVQSAVCLCAAVKDFIVLERGVLLCYPELHSLVPPADCQQQRCHSAYTIKMYTISLGSPYPLILKTQYLLNMVICLSHFSGRLSKACKVWQCSNSHRSTVRAKNIFRHFRRSVLWEPIRNSAMDFRFSKLCAYTQKDM